MISRIDKRFKLLIFFMAAVLLLTSVFPLMIQTVRVNAENMITIYFDTSCTGQDGSNHGWAKDMSNVYMYAYSGNGNTGLVAMTATGKSRPGGGKLFKATVDKDAYSYIIFSSTSSWTHNGTDYKWQTKNYGLSGVTDSSIFILNENGFTDTDNGNRLVQGMYVSGTYSAIEGHAGEKFSILNMTSSPVKLKVRYTNETRNDSGEWSGESSITRYTDATSYDIGARNYWYEQFEVPNNGDDSDPYTTVEIQDSNGNVLKKYYFPEGKILGKTYEYGVSVLSNTTISYQTDSVPATYALNEILYLEKGSFTVSGATVKGETTTAITKSGNASYLTDGNISINSYSKITTAGIYDLSGNIFSVEYNGGTYNLFGPEKNGDNLVIINDNVAVVSGLYTVQSTNNTLTEGNNTYKYITTKADMFDYQYDHTSSTNSSYSYNYDNDSKLYYDKKYIIFTDSQGWNSGNDAKPISAYFYDTTDVGPAFPGTYMTYIGRNSNNEKQFIIEIPEYTGTGTLKVIFNNSDNGKQTSGNDVTENTGYYAKADSDQPAGTWSITSSTSSERGNAKRPYLTINEALSNSTYATSTAASSNTNYPMYLGQFWLPIINGDATYCASSGLYNSATTGQRAAHNSDSDYYVDLTRDRNAFSRYYGFGNVLNKFDWSANLAYRYSSQSPGTYEPYNGVVQGLVKNQLKDYDPNTGGTLMALDNTNTVPYFDKSWWTGKNFDVDPADNTQKTNYFTNSQGDKQKMSDYLVDYSDLDFPFFETDADDITFRSVTAYSKDAMVTNTHESYQGKYYVFDSTKNVVKVDSTGTTLEKHYNVDNTKVWDNYGEGNNPIEQTTDGSEIGFFPFNSPAEGGHDSKELHYGFGVKFSIDFYFNDNGTLDGTVGGIPITFTFQGDDDVWVFLDDKLALDMGGAHKNSIGEINFANKKVVIGSAGDVEDSVAVSSAKDVRTKTFSELGLTGNYVSKGKHKITMYYLERGMLNSNLYVMFNLPMSLTKWELQEDTDFSNVNQGFQRATKYVADQDVFNYTVENKDTTNVVGSEYKVPTQTAVTRYNNEIDNSSVQPITRSTTLSVSNSTAQNTHNFQGSSSGTYTALTASTGDGVSYMISDPFASSNTVNYDTRSLQVKEGNQLVTKTGVVSLQYGEIATVNKQFNYSSGMRVTQLDYLSSPRSGSPPTRAGTGNNYIDPDFSDSDTEKRTVSKYYTTYFKSTSGDATHPRRAYAGIYRGDDIGTVGADHVETLYNLLDNYSANSIVNLQTDDNTTTYNFNDPNNAVNEYVHLRQVVVNQVKTTELKISKDFLTNETNNDSFNFNIYFSNVFGSNDGDDYIDTTSIQYTMYDSSTGRQTDSGSLGANGAFQLKAGYYIVIKDIPVGTKFYITESLQSTSVYKLEDDYSINLGSQSSPVEITSDTVAMVYNNRKTDRMTLKKQVYDENGTTALASNSTTFTVKVDLTAPSGVTLSTYDINANGTPITFIANTTSFKVNVVQGTDIVITGLPYETTYSVSEEETDIPAGYLRCGTDYVIYTDSTEKKIGNATDDTVTVKNKINPISMPTTGGTPLIYLLPFGIIAIALSGAAMIIYKKKLQGYSLLFGRKRR